MKIKEIVLKITSLIVIFNLVFLGPGTLVLAQEATAENTNTGSTSDNTATTTTTDSSDTTNTNDANVDNTTTGGSTSGDNTSDNNTGDASVDTSGAATSATTETTANTVYYEPMSWTTWTGEGDWQSRAINSQTGSTSTNTANVDGTLTENLTNTNNADVTNTQDIGSSTGSNSASDNTGNASINTGDASTISGIQNILNTNYWTGEGDWTNLWNGEALNWRTGSGSTNESSVELDKILSVLNENGVDVDNLINSFSTSGANNASDNTGNATIKTGDASMLATLFNLANTNIFGTDAINILYQDIYGAYNGNINLTGANSFNLPQGSTTQNLNASNSTTGFNSGNISDVIGSLTIDVSNNNTGDLLNDLSLEAISGNNTASDNTGNANIETGDADIIANLINFLNTNIFTNEFYLGVINVYGEWNGSLILPEYNAQNYTGSATLAATNEFTGSSSGNNSTTKTTTNTNIDNNNTGNVFNNFNGTADTGNNSASDNTLNGDIKTGDSNAEANLATFANTNIVSDSPWWLILVNNMGTWIPILTQSYGGSTQLVLDLDDLGIGSATQNLSAGNQMTGSSSSNDANTSTTTDVGITNNNTGTITNNVDALALTGGNQADRNTGFGYVSTGDASIWINALNFLNTNIIAPSFMLAIVNVFGSWNGDVLNSDQASIQTSQSGNSPQGGTGYSGQSGSSGGSSGNASNYSQSADSNQQNPGASYIPPTQTTFVFFSNAANQIGQVLSFSEVKPAGSEIQNLASQNQSLADFFRAWMIGLGLLPIILSIAFWQRNRWIQIIKRSRHPLTNIN